MGTPPSYSTIDGRCEHGSLLMGCLECDVSGPNYHDFLRPTQRQEAEALATNPAALLQRINDLVELIHALEARVTTLETGR